MTIEEYKNKSFADRKQFAVEMENWIGCYTQEVINKVMARIEEIISDKFTMDLIHQLYIRTLDERKERWMSIGMLIEDFEKFKEFDIHNHPSTHARSYRDILWDMYIAK